MGTDAGIPFGNYTLLKRIARGGMAEVFVARQEGMDGFDRMVAIKRILPHLLDDQSFVRMFQDEAKLAARLSHPNVIHIYDFGKVDEHFFIAMELMHAVHAGDLIRLAADTEIPPALVARIGANACAGLHYAHYRCDNMGNPLKLVHRDVSPPNLLISYDGIVKLVDFGIAKAVSSIEQTRPGVVKGKYAFMSPEQTMGQKLDGHSDVFSLALVLWELLAGRSAVVRDNQILAMQTIRDGKVPAITSVRKNVPGKLATALHRALEKSPDDRSDAREFGKELEAFIKGSKEIATNMELGAWLTEHLPPKPILTASESVAGTRRATVATSLRPISEAPNVPEEPEAEMLFSNPASDKTDGAAVTSLISLSAASELTSVKGDLTQDSSERTPLPVEGPDSVVVAMDLISDEQRELRRVKTPTTSKNAAATSRVVATTTENKDAATVVGHGFGSSGSGFEEIDEPTNDLTPPTDVDDDGEATTIESPKTEIPIGERPTVDATRDEDFNNEDPTHQDPTREDSTSQDSTSEDETIESQPPLAVATRGSVEGLPPVPNAAQAMPVSHTIFGPGSGGFAAKAPWIAAAIALLLILAVVSVGDDAESNSPKPEEPATQPIVFDPAEAQNYRRDGGRGLPPIVVTPLSSDAGQTKAPETQQPDGAGPETQPNPRSDKSSRQRKRSSKNMGSLAVKTKPASEVYHRGRKLGRTPLQKLPLKEGRYRLKFVAEGRKAATRSVVIRAGKTTQLEFSLEP